MLKGIIDFSYLLGVEPFWTFLLLALLFVLAIVKCAYPWQPKWKQETKEDKNGNKITKFYHLDE